MRRTREGTRALAIVRRIQGAAATINRAAIELDHILERTDLREWQPDPTKRVKRKRSKVRLRNREP